MNCCKKLIWNFSFIVQPSLWYTRFGLSALVATLEILIKNICTIFISLSLRSQKSNQNSHFFHNFQPVGIYPKKYEWAAHLHSSHLNGDCSLWVRSATLEFDDGVWECQVTASDFTAQDALTSKPVRLVVRGKWYTIILLYSLLRCLWLWTIESIDYYLIFC